MVGTAIRRTLERTSRVSTSRCPDVANNPETATDTGSPTDSGPETSVSCDASINVNILATFAGPPTGLHEWPEGIGVIPNSDGTKGTPIVAFSPLNKYITVATDGGYSTFASFPTADANSRTVAALYDTAGVLGTAGATYVTIGSLTGLFDGGTPTPGVYVVPPGGIDGGTPTLFSKPVAAPADGGAVFPMSIPEALVLHGSKVWIPDSTGAVFQMDSSGNVTPWSTDPLLAGNRSACPAGPPPTPRAFGAIGLVIDTAGANAYVTNFDYGRIVQIPINADGSAGTAKSLIEDCQYQGIKASAWDSADNTFYLVGQLTNTVYKVNPAAKTMNAVGHGRKAAVGPAQLSVPRVVRRRGRTSPLGDELRPHDLAGGRKPAQQPGRSPAGTLPVG